MEQLEESTNPKGATVSANVLFLGKASIKVRHVLVYRESKIVNKTWQIDPKLNVDGVASAKPAAKSTTY